MNSHWISIGALIGMFVLATALPINMGLLAFVGAFLVGTLVAGMGTKAIIGGFPADLFLTLAGITYLFALAQNNGTIDWLVRMAVRAVRGRIAAIPWIMFFIAALLTAVGTLLLLILSALGYAFTQLWELREKVAKAEVPAWLLERLQRIEHKLDKISNGHH